MSDRPLHSVSVAGVTFDEADRILLIKRRDNGEWQLPGGVLEIGETVIHGVAREVWEETGVRVLVRELTGVYKNMRIGVVALVFRCSAIDGTPKETDESLIAEWVDPEEALKRMSQVFAARVQDAVQYPREGIVSVRSHDGVNILDENALLD